MLGIAALAVGSSRASDPPPLLPERAEDPIAGTLSAVQTDPQGAPPGSIAIAISPEPGLEVAEDRGQQIVGLLDLDETRLQGFKW
jgi:hypothetical protein